MTVRALPHPVPLLAAVLAAVALLAAAAAPRAAAAARIDAAVERQIAQAAAGDQLDVIVVLKRQIALPSAPATSRRARLAEVLSALRALASSEQRRIVGLLAIRRFQGRVARVRPYWIFNGLEVIADPDVVHELAALPEVAAIQPNATIQAPSAATDAAAAEWNVSHVGAPALWGLGYRGQGVVVASMDTGVDVTHPDLASRWRGGTNSWYDPNGQHPTMPTDVNGHGTWTMGVMVGGDAGGTSVGVAPDARWIAVKIFNDRGVATVDAIHRGFQWLLDPDGNPATADAPNVVDNSWTMVNGGCDLQFQPDLRNLRAAGVLPVFAAGNGGPAAGGFSPANNPEAFAVGGTDSADAIDYGSSRGPSACGQGAYPQLSAPGVDVRTTDLFGLYMSVSGTSIAAPHAAGALALLLGAFPNTDADRQAAALQSGARDLGAPGPDYDYGAGGLDALGAYNWLSTAADFRLTASPASASTTAGGVVSFNVDVGAVNGFAGDVALSLIGLSPGQGSWSFAPGVVVGSGTAQLTVTTSASLAPGTYPLTIRGTSGSVTHSAGVSLVISAPPSFSLTATPSSASTPAGGTVSYAVSASSVGNFSGDITLSLSGLTGAQATWSFDKPIITGGAGASQLTVTTTGSLAPGSYVLTITGTSGAITRTANVTLVVTAPPDFGLTLAPASATVVAGNNTSYTVSVTSVRGFAGSVTLSVSGLPTGATASFSTNPVKAPGSATLTVRTARSTTRGTFTIRVAGSSGKLSHQATASLVVRS
jgi:subtilisin family serine protease